MGRNKGARRGTVLFVLTWLGGCSVAQTPTVASPPDSAETATGDGLPDGAGPPEHTALDDVSLVDGGSTASPDTGAAIEDAFDDGPVIEDVASDPPLVADRASDATAADGAAAPGAGEGGPVCWQLPPVTRVRLFPAPGRAAQMQDGKILGSGASPTNGFVELASISAPPAEGQWMELTFANATAYRYVKYSSPAGSYGAIAEIEFYDGPTRLTGRGFATAGSRDGTGNTFDRALDGNTGTFFEGPLPDDSYVGLDLGAGHETAAPTFSPAGGTFAGPQTVTVASATPGASIRDTRDGTEPTAGGTLYSGPLSLGDGVTTIKAIATLPCSLDSTVSRAAFRIGVVDGGAMQSASQSTIHLGDSLTDTIVDRLDVIAATGGVTVDFHRFTIPGADTQWLWDHPTEGFGEANIMESLRTYRYDRISVQPFGNGPCTPAGDGSDGDYANRFYSLAKQGNPNVGLWIYQQWPSPSNAPDCLSVGAPFATPPWVPPVPDPATWEQSVGNQLAFHEQVRTAVMNLNPGGNPIYIVPAGLALRDLKREVEAGRVSGVTDFFFTFFAANGTEVHLTDPGRYFVTLVFYASMLQRDPRGLGFENMGVTAAQATKFQDVVWTTVTGYQFSGLGP